MASRFRLPLWVILLALPGLYLLGLFLVPILYMLMFSFWQYSQIDIVVRTFTIENYLALLSPYYLRLFGRTFSIGLTTTLVAAVLAFPVAYFIARARPAVKSLAIFLIMTPLMISTVVRVFGLALILQRDGVLNQFLALIGLPAVLLARTQSAIVIGLVQMLLPLMVLPLVSAIERISPSIEEAARNLGANSGRVFATVVFPLALPGLVSGCVLVYTLSISALVIPALLGGAGDRMIGQQIYDQMLVALNWPSSAALSTVLAVFTIIFAVLGLSLTARAARLREAGR
jgi:putative spermidine/putrescine transport system permease protein